VCSGKYPLAPRCAITTNPSPHARTAIRLQEKSSSQHVALVIVFMAYPVCDKQLSENKCATARDLANKHHGIELNSLSLFGNSRAIPIFFMLAS
jgi:hypothetical protein